MTQETGPIAAERAFFAALIAGNAEALAELLADDFLLIDVMSGSEIERETLLGAVGGGQLAFESIEPAEARERVYGVAAVVTGRTQMRGSFGGVPFTATSRYTHVWVRQYGRWRLASAQGTQIAP